MAGFGSEQGRNVRRRFFRVAKIFFTMFIDFSREYSLVRRKGYRYAVEKMRPAHERHARELYEAAVSMGGVLIKLCQYFSARRDVFPDEYIKALSPLQDSVPPVSWDEIEAVIAAEYGDYAGIFASIEREPLASASLGQVHRARLRDGREAVLKILKPGIEEVIDTDFAILYFTFKLFSHFKGFREHADFFAILSEFVRVTGDELNFRREAYIAREFRRYFSRLDYVTVPVVYDEYCTGRIIAMEYHEGNRINDMASWSRRNNDPITISRRIVEMYVEQFLSMPFIHFDPHPGNILITDDNCIVLVDYGMAGEISDRMRRGFSDSIEALIDRDARKLIDVLNDLGFIRRNVHRYSLLPIADFFINEILDTFKLERESFYNIDLSPIRDEIVEIIYTQPFTIPIDWAYIGKTLSTVAGLISQLNPDFNLYGELKRHTRRILSAGVADRAVRAYNSIKANVSTAAAMPMRISEFMDDLERGYFKIKVDYGEMIDKIDEVKGFVIRVIAFILALVAGVSAYVFFNEQRIYEFLMFLVLGAAALLFFLLYRRRFRRDKIRDFFNE